MAVLFVAAQEEGESRVSDNYKSRSCPPVLDPEKRTAVSGPRMKLHQEVTESFETSMEQQKQLRLRPNENYNRHRNRN
jgi:hypothetical protein